MNAKNGEVLHCEECDTKLHPAGLTKLITLYVVFSEIENGKISLDEQVEVSRKASAELPAKLGLLPGQKIKVRYLIRATGVMGILPLCLLKKALTSFIGLSIFLHMICKSCLHPVCVRSPITYSSFKIRSASPEICHRS